MTIMCVLAAVSAMAAAGETGTEAFTCKEAALAALVELAPGQRASFDPETGRFGEGIWIVQDQQRMYPLAAVYATPGEGNPYYKDAALLEVIMKAGDALIDDADENGQWEFRKKDGSTWGMIHMPWTYSRWVRSFALIKDDMPAPRRAAWEKALALGYGRIAQSLEGGHVHNIPTHHAMGLYVAGQCLERPEWCEAAATFMKKVVETQQEGGYWSEGTGPVVAYNFVYTDALGTYYFLSRDDNVLKAIRKAATFHYRFTYPDGACVETIDERNPYSASVRTGNVGFTFTPDGRAFLARQWKAQGGGMEALGADFLASLVLYGEEGPVPEMAGAGQRDLFVLEEGGMARAATLREGPWFVCVSAYCAPVPQNRWLQDRQNLVSVFHDKAGLILGGGNTKLQPAWSTFTAGDAALLQHTPGDESPDFQPKGALFHVPSEGALLTDGPLGLDLKYGEEACKVYAMPKGATTLEYRVEASSDSHLPVAAHLTLLPHVGEMLVSGSGTEVALSESALDWDAEELKGSLAYGGVRFGLPSSASLHWPAKGHNPYAKDGAAPVSKWRIEVRIPLDAEHPSHTVTMEVLP